MTDLCLALNAGSSSLKFALAPAAAPAVPVLSGTVERIGRAGATLTLRASEGARDTLAVPADTHAAALRAVDAAITERHHGAQIVGVGHRVVHGGSTYYDPVVLTGDVVTALRALNPLAPLHQPACLLGVDTAMAHYPDAVHVGCFDTAFHARKPWVQDAFALPRHFYEDGVRRYGFHGLSCQSIRRGLIDEGYPFSDRKLVIAHLGNGCSVTAVAGGIGQACSMGFSALDGLTMGTRCGRLDPGVILHLMRDGLGLEDIEDLLYRRSGLLGLSGQSNDMRDLTLSDRPEAAEAVTYFTARVVEEVCRMAGVLGGLDTLVFCGGIGENAGDLRDRITAGLSFLPGRTGQGIDVLVRETSEEGELLRATAEAIAA